MKILFLTTANLSHKPRLVKEIQLAKEQGFDIELISCKVGNWSDHNHLSLVKELGIENHEIDVTRRNFFWWILCAAISAICARLWPFFKGNLLITAFASNKRTILLFKHLLVNKKKADLVNGRNTATLYPLYYVAVRNKIACSFDIEDYHPGESVTWTNPIHEAERREALMLQILPYSRYITYAGEAIGSEAKELLAAKSKLLSWIDIGNTFSNADFAFKPPSTEKKVKIIWFSLDITKDRGLELFMPVLFELKDKVEVTLIGNLNPDFHNTFLKQYDSIIRFHEPKSQFELHRYICEFDAGLAIEMSSADMNKNLAISNKIFAYALAGLFIIATDTLGQQSFMKENSFCGVTCAQNPNDVRRVVKYVIENIDTIRKQKNSRFTKAQLIGWEYEKQKLLDTWKEILTNK